MLKMTWRSEEKRLGSETPLNWSRRRPRSCIGPYNQWTRHKYNCVFIQLLFCVRSEVLATVFLKIRVFWNVTPCRRASVSCCWKYRSPFNYRVKQSTDRNPMFFLRCILHSSQRHRLFCLHVVSAIGTNKDVIIFHIFMPDIIISIMIDIASGIAVCTSHRKVWTSLRLRRTLTDPSAAWRHVLEELNFFSFWVSNPRPSDRMQPALLSYTASSHIWKVCMWYKT